MIINRLSETAGNLEDGRPTRRVDYRSITRTVLAMTVGSAFEGEWAYLQLARRSMPASYKGALDRWRGWFVHCDPQATFPRWVKTNRPGDAGPGGVYLGPLPDKHAAQRYIEMLQGAFDLCRHHNILVQAPNATACAYKEMGRCPAPCDGSVTLDSYRGQIREAAEFGSAHPRQWREKIERTMARAARDMDYETAERCRRMLDATEPSTQRKFAFVDRLENFRFLAGMPAEDPGYARLYVVRGGWIAPVVDVPLEAQRQDLGETAAMLTDRLNESAPDASEDAIENIGLVCHHLFRPHSDKRGGIFMRCADGISQPDLAGALRKLRRQESAEDAEAEIAESSLEG
ncbi:MAG: hypothetical protein JSV91_08855 [Phycisphaerales bacterium]|nr:MAG: hypothetical protein JSV91_08855 [Phycisphaerales bacterium]